MKIYPTSPDHHGVTTQQSGRSRADALRKLGRFDEAAAEYAALWPDHDEWTGWGYAYCLRKLGRSADALAVAQEVYTIAPDFPFGQSVYRWSLYDAHVRHIQDPNAEALAAARIIVHLSEKRNDSYSVTNPFVPTVLRVARALSRRGRDKQVLGWLDKLDPNFLGTVGFTFASKDGKVRQLASQRERYFSLRTRALERLGKWEECIQTAQRGLRECESLHHDNEIWFARRIALAKLQVGRTQEAVSELEQLSSRKSLSFLQTDLASATLKIGDEERALKHALRAVLDTGEIRYQLEAVKVIADILVKRNDVEEARRHVKLILSVRKAQGWKNPPSLTDLATTLSIDGSEYDMYALLNSLRGTWKAWSNELDPDWHGTVRTILPHGRSGFVTMDGHQFYFDMRQWCGGKLMPKKGMEVLFKKRPGFDPKRNMSSIVAWNVRPFSKESQNHSSGSI